MAMSMDRELTNIEALAEAVLRERQSATAGIGVAMLWLLSDDQDHIARSMARDMELKVGDFRRADLVERIAYAGWSVDDLAEALVK